MNLVVKVSKKQTFKILAIFLLLFSMLTPSFSSPWVFAENDERIDYKDGEGDHGNTRNEKDGNDYDRASINKQVSFGNKPGEYFIDLTITGKDNRTIDTTDIIIVYDLSNSMENNTVPGTNQTRTKVAHDATVEFINDLLGESTQNFRMAFVPYGSSVMDGKTRTKLSGQFNEDSINPYDYYVGTFTANANTITTKIPSSISHGNHGGTFTQQGLERAGQIMNSQSVADNKIIVTITDGLPTVSYDSNGNYTGDGSEGQGSLAMQQHRSRTINEATLLKNRGYELYTIGVGLSPDNTNAMEVVNGISSEPLSTHAHTANSVSELTGHLKDISETLKNSIINGSVEDPMGEYFQLQGADSFTAATTNELTDGNYYLSGNKDGLTEGVTVTTEGQKIKVNGLNLGADETITLRYKVQIDTDKEGFEADTLYRTNGETILTPISDKPDEKNKFPEPKASAKGITVEGEKIWEDFGYEGNRPDDIIVKLMNGDNEVDRVTVTPDDDGNWEYKFDDAIWYDSNGDIIEYTFSEEPVHGYEMVEPNDGEKIVNKLIADPEISLEKTGKSTSSLGENVIEVGRDIEYTFTITNTGNLPLKDITLTDELEGISEFEYVSLNDEDFTGNIEALVLQPIDVLVATATYTVTQEDFDHGQVNNHATVKGTSTVPEPDDNFTSKTVEDDDKENVPGELEPKISLEKTASKETVSEAGEEMTYSFTIKNTGNTTLTDVKLNDPMLGGDITLDNTTLQPGEETTVDVTYETTQEDLNNGEILNEANVEGTPPPAYTENPNNPKKVTDEDDEKVTSEQDPAIELIKEGDKEELVVDEEITYTFTATNTGNVTLTNVTITDELEGISDITYVSVNEEDITDPENITLEPGDVLVANATYDVTQKDIDYGQVYNKATVTGKDPNDEDVTDDDEVTVGHDPELGIELTKTSDKQVVTEVGEEIEFTFEVTNTSSVTLTDVKVLDPMLNDLDINIELEKTTLKPGETTTGKATYTVTEEDIEKGSIKNLATATGTPPNPEHPEPEDPSEVEVKVAKIELKKSSQPGIFTEVGQEITYTLKVTNTGEVTLNNIVLNDEKLGGEIELDVNSLKPGKSTEVEVTYTVTEADVEAGEVLNTADVTGEPEGYDPKDENSPQPVTDEDNDKVLYAALELTKTSDKEEVTEAGEEITYTFEVTNTGKVTLENVEVNDPKLEDLDIEISLDKTMLEPGESTTGTAIYTVTQEDIDKGGVTNVATATGTPPGFDPEDPNFPDEPPVSPPSENEVPADQNPAIELTKVADKSIFTEVGERVKYTFTVTNIGNVTLTDVNVTDDTFGLDVGLVKHDNIKDLTVELAPGESATGQFTYIVTQEDMDNDEIINVANTAGTPPPVTDPEDPENPVEQDPVTDEDEEKVKGKQEADLALEKQADKENVVKAGDEITYTLTVTNTGNVTLDNVTVNDEMLGGVLEVNPSTLAPGDKGTVEGTYTVTQEDIDNELEIKNIATATGTPPGEDPEKPETPPVEENVPVTKDPEITLVKQADKEELVAGETITYTFTATNTGNQTLTNVNITDNLEGLSDITYVSVNGDAISNPDEITLKPGDILVATATYDVTQDDVNKNEVYNKAIVEGTPPPMENPEDPDNPIEQDPVTDDDDTKVPSVHKPDIEIVKSSDKEEITEAGQLITYKFTVTNTGNVTLDNVKVNDEMLAELDIDITLDKTTLDPGESTVGYAEYTVTQDDIDNKAEVLNIATATGTPPNYDPEDPPTDPEDPGNPPVSPPSEERVPVVKYPDIEIVKAADKVRVTEAGEEIEYTFTVTNTGNVTLTDVVVNDEKLGGNIELNETTLAPGESTTGTATYIVTQEEIDSGMVENVATTTGFPPGYDKENPPTDPNDPTYPPTDEGEELVPAEQSPDISLEKLVDRENVYTINGGDEIEYTFIITNTGNVTLTDVELDDPMLGGNVKLENTTLAPGESTTVTVPYTITKEDYEKGYVDNHATTTGTPPGYDPEDPNNPGKPEDEDEESVKTKHPAIQLIKTSDTPVISEVGQLVTYTFKVKNAGNVTLNDVVVEDPMFGGKISLPKTTLEPGETVEGYARYVVKAADLENNELENIATTTGTPVGYDPEDPKSPQPPTDEDDEIIPTEKGENAPKIQLEKTSDKKQVNAGDKVTYTFTVTNTGKVTLYNVIVEDDMIDSDIKLGKTILEPGESTIGTATYTVTEEDVKQDTIKNVATTTGYPEGYDPENPPTDPSDPTNPVKDEDEDIIYPGDKLPHMNPAIKLLKTSDTTLITEEGQVITYFFKVTNTGDVALEDVTLFDPMLEESIVKLEKTKLNPGESTYGTGTYIATKADIGKKELPNTATTFGYSPMYTGERINLENKTLDQIEKELEKIIEENPGSVPEDTDVEVIPSTGSSIQLIKTTDTEVASEVGQVITYIFKVKNTGAITLHDVEINDPMLGGNIKLDQTTLEPGETTYVTVAYVVTAEDLEKDEIVNIATTTGTPEGYDPEDPNSPEKPTDEDREKTPTEKGQQQPAIQLEKTSDKDVVAEVGEEITYTFVVTNTGGVTLTDVEVNDPMLGGNIELDQTTLAPGESTVGTATYEVTAEDLDKFSIDNVAIATGTPEGYDPEDPNSPDKPTDEDEDKVYTHIVPPANASIKLLKTSNTLSVSQAGETVKYTFKVTNNGDVTLTDIKITDEMLENAGVEEIKLGKTKLAPGEFTYGTAEYTATQADIDQGTIYNLASVEGTPPGYDPEDPNSPKKPTDEDDIDVPTHQGPAIELDKSSDINQITTVGQEVTYTFTVTNTGNVTLTDIEVTDPMIDGEIELKKTTLAPGESTTGTAIYVATQADLDNGELVNVANVEGTPPGYDPENPDSPEKPRDEDEDRIPVDVSPSISLEKTSDTNKVTEVGQKINYTFKVTNTGGVTLSNITLNDPMLGGYIILTETTLAPGESTTITVEYVVTKEDLEKEELINVADVTGHTPDGKSVKDEDENIVQTDPPSDGKLVQTSNNYLALAALGILLLLAGSIFLIVHRRKVRLN